MQTIGVLEAAQATSMYGIIFVFCELKDGIIAVQWMQHQQHSWILNENKKFMMMMMMMMMMIKFKMKLRQKQRIIRKTEDDHFKE